MNRVKTGDPDEQKEEKNRENASEHPYIDSRSNLLQGGSSCDVHPSEILTLAPKMANGVRWRVRGEIARPTSAGPRASLPQEGEAAQRELMRRSGFRRNRSCRPVSLPSRGVAYRVVAPVDGIPTEGSLPVAPGRRCPYRGGHPGRHGSLPRGDATESEGPVPRNTNYPIPTRVGRVRVPEVRGSPMEI